MDNKSFQISVKGLILKDKKVLLLHEAKGTWDLPGGRLQHGEGFEQTLKKECEEEMGVQCELLDTQPLFSWVAQDSAGRWRALLCFRIKPEHFDFKESNECSGFDFFDKDSFDAVNVVPQIRQLKDYL